MKRVGVDAVYATNHQEGFQLAKKLVPEAIVTDMDLPGMNGLVLCQLEGGSGDFRHFGSGLVKKSSASSTRAGHLRHDCSSYTRRGGRLTKCLRWRLNL